MNIEHVAMYVNDLAAARDFFQTYFGASCGDEYHNPTTGFRSYFLTFDGGARVELMQKPGALPGGSELREGWAHLSFTLGSRGAVDAATERLRAAGCAVESGPRVTGDGYYESCVLDPEGNRVELMA